jgi:branched-chain amino acid transport system substrate-binding protein
VTGDVVLAGASLSLSGSLSVQGEQAHRGLKLWATSTGADGIVVGGLKMPVELVVVDDESKPARARRNTEKLLEDGAEILFGPYGSAAGRAVASLAHERGVLVWNHGAAADDVARAGVITLPTPASRYFVRVVEFARARGCTSAVLLEADTPFTKTVAAGASERAASLGMTVERHHVGRKAGLRQPLEAVASKGRVILLCGSLQDDIDGVAALRAAKSEPCLIAALGAGVAAFGAALGERAVGVLGPSQWEPDAAPVDVGPTSTEAVALYRGRFGKPPDYVAIQAWAAGVLAEAALSRAGRDREAIWTWALSWRGRTLYGDFAIDRHGRQIGHHIQMVQWNDEGQREVLAHGNGCSGVLS